MAVKRMARRTFPIAATIVWATSMVAAAVAGGPDLQPLKVGDSLTVTVKEATGTIAKSTHNRESNGQYAAQMAQFIRINAQGNLDNTGQNSPEIDRELQSRLQSTGQVKQTHLSSYRVAATIVEILPNCVVVLEAHQSGVDNKSLWIWMLSGKVDPKKRTADGSVLSENIDDLAISKRVIDVHDRIGPF
jgi:flagellar basal body L-ring protein FlgH